MAKTTEKNTEAATEAASGIKSFKSSSEVENFYRFIHENNLRAEAHKLVSVVLKKIAPPKRRGRRKTIQ